MRYVVLICKDPDALRLVDAFENVAEHDSSSPGRFALAISSLRATAGASVGPATRGYRFDSSRIAALTRQPFMRWLAAPVLGVPSVYSGYSTMLNFWHWMGAPPSLGLHALAVIAGVTGGLLAIARLRT